MVQVLKQCGDDLTRENVMKQAASLKNFELDVLLPGIKINTSPTDFAPIESEQLATSTARSGCGSAKSSASSPPPCAKVKGASPEVKFGLAFFILEARTWI